jgi:transposase
MTESVDILPDNILELKAIIAKQQEALSSLKSNYEQKITHLQQQINLLLHKRFAPSSEQAPPEQHGLFDEAELATLNPEPEFEEEESITVPAHQRKRGKRAPLPQNLPRIEVLHDLSDEEKVCPHDGTPLKRIGEEVSEQLDIIPAQIQVLRHVRPKYSCPCCEDGVQIAKLPPQPIPKSMASPGLLAWIVICKYMDALPLYRLEKMIQRIGVDIPRTTMAKWMIRCGLLVQILIKLMREQMLEYDHLQMDETTVQVLDEKGRRAQSKSYMWVQRGGPPGRPIILFDYDPSRSSEVPTRLLEGYQGYLQTDGYAGYNDVVKENDLIHLGCWAHARRKFDETIKAQGKKKQKAGRAHQGMAYIRALYRIEREAKDMSPEERADYRQQHAVPKLKIIREWLDESLPKVPPTSYVGKALTYLNNQWPRLIIYVEDGRLSMDNNLTENAIRPFAIGRNYDQLTIMQSFLSRLVPKAGSFAVFSFFDTLDIVIKIVFPVGSSLVTGVDHDRRYNHHEPCSPRLAY